MACIPTMTEIRGAIHDAASQTDRVEQGAMALLHERGAMTDLTCDQQREVADIVRCELLRKE